MRFPIKPFLAAALCLAAAITPARARTGGDIGAGFIAGDPSGLSGKIWLNDVNALDLILGFSIVDHDEYLAMRADYVWHEFSLFPVRKGQLPLYYGIGLGTEIGRRADVLSARGVVGIAYLFPTVPLDAFLELGPGSLIIPRTRFDFSGGVGMRFFF